MTTPRAAVGAYWVLPALLCLLHGSPASASEIVAHRGFEACLPENTVAAIDAATWVADPADVVEFDVRVSADGDLVVIHDKTVDRTAEPCIGDVDSIPTDGSPPCGGLTAMVADSGPAPLGVCDSYGLLTYPEADEKIPTIEDALCAVVPPARARLERKAGTVAQWVAGLTAALAACQQPPPDNLVVSIGAADWDWLDDLANDPDIQALDEIEFGALGGLSGSPGGASASISVESLAWIAARDFMADSDRITWDINNLHESDAALARAAGYRLLGWTVHMEDDDDVSLALSLDLDGVVTNDPVAAAAVFGSLVPQREFLTPGYTILRISNDPDLLAYDTKHDFLDNADVDGDGIGKVNYGNTPTTYENDGWFSWHGAIYRTTGAGDLFRYGSLADFLTNRYGTALAQHSNYAGDEWFVFEDKIYRVTSPTGAIIRYDSIAAVIANDGTLLATVGDYDQDGWFSVEGTIYRISSPGAFVIEYENIAEVMLNQGDIIWYHTSYADDGWLVIFAPTQVPVSSMPSLWLLALALGMVGLQARRWIARA